MYLGDKREKRSLVASERQWVFPMIIEASSKGPEFRLKRIDSLLKLDLSSETTTFLNAEKIVTVAEQTTLGKSQLALRNAEQNVERLEKQAAKKEQQTLAIVQRTELLAQEPTTRSLRSRFQGSTFPGSVVAAQSSIAEARPEVVEIPPEVLAIPPKELKKRLPISQQESREATEAVTRAARKLEGLVSENNQLIEELAEGMLHRFKAY